MFVELPNKEVDPGPRFKSLEAVLLDLSTGGHDKCFAPEDSQMSLLGAVLPG